MNAAVENLDFGFRKWGGGIEVPKGARCRGAARARPRPGSRGGEPPHPPRPHDRVLPLSHWFVLVNAVRGMHGIVM